MKAPGEAAIDLPWLAPCVGSLTALARKPFPEAWAANKQDPGFALLVARCSGDGAARDVDLLHAAAGLLGAGGAGPVDWSLPGPALVYGTSLARANLAAALAAAVGGVEVERAWLGGLVAPLGWLAICAVDPGQVDRFVDARPDDGRAWQRQAWGFDQAAVARRLSRKWHLPAWLASVVGGLGLNADVAAGLGADRALFQVIQLAALLVQRHDPRLQLIVGGDVPALCAALHLDDQVARAMLAEAVASPPSQRAWESPARHPLLIDVIELALQNRRRDDQVLADGLQREVDRLHEALERQCADEQRRVQALKLAGLAEMAAGAGHEINNPLAVISGQAQYLLRQLELLDGPADEIDDVGEYLDNLRGKVVPSLQKIIGQTHRVHSILTDLMHFARPTPPRVEPTDVAPLVREVVRSLQPLAEERRVRLQVGDTADAVIAADPAQVRTALTALVRNAVEAAPPDGWANVRVEAGADGVRLVVEDSGPGPAAPACEHLFDPFFSGRSAGRGRGMGLPTAWRLARQHGGDVHFDGNHDGVTRFVLALPAGDPEGASDPPHARNGHHGYRYGRAAALCADAAG